MFLGVLVGRPNPSNRLSTCGSCSRSATCSGSCSACTAAAFFLVTSGLQTHRYPGKARGTLLCQSLHWATVREKLATLTVQRPCRRQDRIPPQHEDRRIRGSASAITAELFAASAALRGPRQPHKALPRPPTTKK
eukprot:963997-Amphidinium_carterae.1